MQLTKEHRSHPRYPLPGPVGLSWADSRGSFRTLQAKGVDIGITGLQVELSEPIEVRSAVQVRAERHKLSATTTVRYCLRTGPRFRVGLEFISGSRWRPPEA